VTPPPPNKKKSRLPRKAAPVAPGTIQRKDN
jgi:hypothetical protein